MKEAASLGGVDQTFKNSIYGSAEAITGLTTRTLKAMADVVRSVPEQVKNDFDVSFAHLALVAKYPEDQQREYLQQIQLGKLSVAEARNKIAYLTAKVNLTAKAKETTNRQEAVDEPEAPY